MLERKCRVNDVSFVVDEMCGKLARWLRLLGYDTFYKKSTNKSEEMDYYLLSKAIKEKRVLITKDLELVKRAKQVGVQVVLLTGDNIINKLKSIFVDYLKCNEIVIEPRCPICNSKLEPLTKKEKKRTYRCTNCGKIYWFGGHWESIREILKKVGLKYEIRRE